MKFIFIALFVFLSTATSHAEEVTSSERSGLLSGASKTSLFRGVSGNSAKGVRLGVFKPSYQLRSEEKGGGQDRKDEFESIEDDDFGVTFGYVSYPIRALGFDVLAHWAQIADRGAGLARLEASMGYAYNRFMYFKAGLNVADVTGIGDAFNPGVGGQLGLGVQATENIGLTMTWTMMSLNETDQFTDVSFNSATGALTSRTVESETTV